MHTRKPVRLPYPKQPHMLCDTNSIDVSGNNLLHVIAMDMTNIYPKAEIIIDSIGVDTARQLALTVNFNGELPVDLVKPAKNEHPEKAELRAAFYYLMQPADIPPLAHDISLHEVMSRFYSADNQDLNYHLNIAREAANRASTMIQESNTHPQSNRYSNYQWKSLLDDIEDMRDEIEQHCDGKSGYEKLKINAEFIQRYGIGNCTEFALICLYEVIKIDYRVSAEIFTIGNGDHVFLVLGRHANSSYSRFKTWGPSAVVCDAHLRRVYPAKFIPQYLKDHGTYFVNGQHCNVSIHFNPDYHVLTPEFKLPKMSHVELKGKLQALGFFANSDKITDATELKQISRNQNCSV